MDEERRAKRGGMTGAPRGVIDGPLREARGEAIGGGGAW